MPTKSVGLFGAGTLYVQKDDGSYEKFADVKEGWEDLVGSIEAERPEQEVVFDAGFDMERILEGSFTIKPHVIIDGEYKEVE